MNIIGVSSFCQFPTDILPWYNELLKKWDFDIPMNTYPLDFINKQLFFKIILLKCLLLDLERFQIPTFSSILHNLAYAQNV